jgi:hypothetical protein
MWWWKEVEHLAVGTASTGPYPKFSHFGEVLCFHLIYKQSLCHCRRRCCGEGMRISADALGENGSDYFSEWLDNNR